MVVVAALAAGSARSSSTPFSALNTSAALSSGLARTSATGTRTTSVRRSARCPFSTQPIVPPDRLQPVIAINCPTVLFPYVREALADAVSRAGFPPVHLAPISFEALYQQQLAQMQQQPQPAAAVN